MVAHLSDMKERLVRELRGAVVGGVPMRGRGVLGGPDGDEPAQAVLEAQDLAIAEQSGRPPIAIKSIRRSN